jgi:PAS domain S-box-containing protein
MGQLSVSHPTRSSESVIPSSIGAAKKLAALQVDQELFRMLVESAQDYAIFLLTPEGNIASWNKGAENIKGYSADEIVGEHFSRFYPPEMIDRRWPQTELRLAKERGRFEDEGWRIRKDGSRFWANVTITALFTPRGELRGYAKITRDLTERKLHEEALRASDERLHLLIDNVRDYAIFMLDADGRIASWNSGAQRLKGYAANEIIGQHFSRFYPQEAIDRQWPEHELRVAAKVGRFEDEGWRVRKDGSRFWANVVIAPIYDPNRKLRGFTKVTRDLTERSRLLAMQSSEKHIDEFLAMLGHELRNPIGAISNAASIIKRSVDGGGMVDKASEILGRQIKLVTRIIDDLLDVARIRRGRLVLRPERLELRPIVEQAVESVPLIGEKSHRLNVQFADAPLHIMGDAARLVQIFGNVLTNAAKYMDPGGSIDVTVGRDGDEAVVSIKDTGKGIDSELLPNVFDLFRQGERTLHNAQGGLGIGLTLVHRVLQLHGGTIKAFSHGIDQGSEFVIRLPLLQKD